MIDDERLGAILASIGADLDVGADLTSDAPSDVGPRRTWWTVLAVAAVGVAVVVGSVLVIAPARRAVSGWLRIGSTEVATDPESSAATDELPPFVAAVAPISSVEAARRLGRPLPDLAATALGSPDAWLGPPEGGVLAVWDDAGTSLWVLANDEGGEQIFQKTVTAAEQVSELDGLGDRALVITGEHVFETPLRRVRAAAAVLWLDGAMSYRLESDRSVDEVVTLAHDVANHPGDPAGEP